MNKNALKNYENMRKQKALKIGVIGNANKGKSFILSKISKMDLPSGMSIKTEGLSIIYPDLKIFKDRKIVLLDSAGLETPVLKSDINQEDDRQNEQFREKSREKLITELFLQNYIINNSDILIVVVDSLTFSEQKLLIKVKKEMERAKRKIPLKIIHNLKSYTSVKQVEDYIKNTLLKSATFNLTKGHIVNTKVGSSTGIYFNEITDNDKHIQHLFYANESSPAGEYYNRFTLNFIENSYQNVTNLESFDVIQTIKERYINLSQDIIEKNDETITLESFDISDPSLIKLKSEKEITLKKCLIDELGFSNFKANGYEPTYNIYRKDNKIIVRVEAPGNSNIASDIEWSGGYNIIRLTGEKRKDKEPENIESNIYNNRENGKITLEIPLKAEDYLLKSNCVRNNHTYGVFNFEYELEKKQNQIGCGVEEGKEI